MLRANPPRLSQNGAGRSKCPNSPKKGLFLSRLQDQSGRLAISGNKYDRLIKAGYVLPEHGKNKKFVVTNTKQNLEARQASADPRIVPKCYTRELQGTHHTQVRACCPRSSLVRLVASWEASYWKIAVPTSCAVTGSK
jgi:hypothetical protein